MSELLSEQPERGVHRRVSSPGDFLLACHIVFSLLLVGLAVAFAVFEHTEALEWLTYIIGSAVSFPLLFLLAYVWGDGSPLHPAAKFISAFLCVLYPAFLLWAWWPRGGRLEFLIFHALLLCLVLVYLAVDRRCLIDNDIRVPFSTLAATNVLCALAAVSLFCGDVDPYSPFLSLFELTLGGACAIAMPWLWRRLDERGRLVLGCAALAFIAVLFAPAQLPPDYLHYAPYAGPPFDLLHGRDPIHGIPTIYGLLTMQAIALPFRLLRIPVDLPGILVANVVLFYLSFAAAGLLFWMACRNRLHAILYTAAFIAALFVDSPEEPQTGPMRFGLLLVMVILTLRLSGRPLLAATCPIAAVSFLWSPDVAVLVIPAWLFSLSLPVFAGGRLSVKAVLALGRTALAAVAGCAVLVVLMALPFGFTILTTAAERFRETVNPAESEWSSLLSEPYGTFYLAVPMLLFGLGLVLWLAVRGHTSKRMTALAFISMSNLAGFSYCVYIGGAGFLHLFPTAYIIQWALMLEVVREGFDVKPQTWFRLGRAVFAVYMGAAMMGQLNDLYRRFHDGTIWQTIQRPQPPFLCAVAEELKLPRDRIGLVSYASTQLCCESGIPNLFPFNPIYQTTYTGNWRKRYLAPAVKSLRPGDIIVYQRDIVSRPLFIGAFVDCWRLEHLARRPYIHTTAGTSGAQANTIMLDIYRVAGPWEADMGNTDTACAAYRDAIARSPRFFEAYERLDALLEPHPAERRQEWMHQRQVRPNEVFPAYFLGRALSASGEKTGAVEAYQAAIAIDPTYQFIWEELAQAFEDLGQWENAAAACRQVVQMEHLNRAKPLEREINAYVQLGRNAEAWQAAMRLWKDEYMWPSSPEFFDNLRRQLGKDGPWARLVDSWWYARRLPI